MKKFLIMVLLMIPFIILATINVSGMIISAAMDITVEKIVLTHEGEPVSHENINVSDYLKNGKKYYIECKTYPTIANAELVWTTSEPSIATVEDGYVTFTGIGFGTVKITVHSKINVNVNAMVTFFVTGDEVVRIDLMPYGGASGDVLTVAEGGSALLTKQVIPASAIREKTVIWSSANNAIATVDGSGIVTGVGSGETTISAVVMEDGEPVEGTIRVRVTESNALFNAKTAVIAADSVDLAQYTDCASLSVVSGEATLSGTSLQMNSATGGDVVVRATDGEVTEDLTITFTAGEWRVGFVNLDVLESTLWADGASVNLAVYDISAQAYIQNDDYTGATPVYTMTAADSDILGITADGLLFGKKSGTTTLTISAPLSAYAFRPFELEITVKAPMENVQLALDNDNDNKGIEGIVVFGNQFRSTDAYGETTLVNTYQMVVASFSPATADEEYIFTSDNEAYATVTDTGLVTFFPAACGNTVTITVFAKYTFSTESVRDSYTFSIVDGINIGLDDNAQYNTVDEPVFDYYHQLRGYVMDSTAGIRQSAVLHTDIYIPSRDVGGDRINPRKNIYGNGYTLDGRYYVTGDSSQLLGYFNDEIDVHSELRNIMLNGCMPPEDESDWQAIKETGGFGVNIGVWHEYATEKTLTMKYVLLQNLYTPVYLSNGTLVADGCLVKNTVSTAFMLLNNTTEFPTMTMRNCIISNTLVPAVMIFSYPGAKIEDGKYARLHLEGENYIYNWKVVQELRFDVIPSSALPNNLADVLNNTLNDQVKMVFADGTYDYLKREYAPVGALQKDEYINLGIIAVGLWVNSTKYDVVYDEKKWQRVELDLTKTTIGAIFSTEYPVYLYTNIENGTFNTSPNEGYADASDENGNPIFLKRLRGER